MGARRRDPKPGTIPTFNLSYMRAHLSAVMAANPKYADHKKLAAKALRRRLKKE